MKEEIFGNIVEVRRKSDIVMAVVPTLGREVMRIICMGHKAKDLTHRKFIFMMKWRRSGTWKIKKNHHFLEGF